MILLPFAGRHGLDTSKLAIYKSSAFAVTKPFIDKVTITYNPGCKIDNKYFCEEDYVEQINCTHELFGYIYKGQDSEAPFVVENNNKLKENRYLYSLIYKGGSDDFRPLIQYILKKDIKKKYEGYPFKYIASNIQDFYKKFSFRIEFNPSKANSEQFEKFKSDLIEHLRISWDDIIKHGKATRIDFAIDLIGVPKKDLIYEIKQFSKSQNMDEKLMAYNTLNGREETIYFNKKSNKKNYGCLIYDKSGECNELGKPHPYPKNEGQHNVTRIETRIFRARDLSKIGKISDMHFPDIDLYYAKNKIDLPDKPYCWEMFLQIAKKRGLERALLFIPETFNDELDLREQYRKAFSQANSFDFNLKELWKKHLSYAVESSELLKPIS